MSRSNAASRRRGEERIEQLRVTTERVHVLEDTLHACWMWIANDAVDVETLRKILMRADHDAQLIAALDRLVKEPR